MKRSISYVEQWFTIIALIMFTEGPLPLLVSGGYSQGDDDFGVTSTPLSRLLFLTVYAITVALLLRNWKPVLMLVVQEKSILLLVVLALLSISWSINPFITFASDVALIGTALFGIYLGTRYTIQQQLQLLAWALGLVMIISLIFILFFPYYGIMGGYHEGIWRGIYTHKNFLGGIMGLSVFVFLLLAIVMKQRHWLIGLAFFGSIFFLILSTSKAAILASAVTLIILGCYWAWLRLYAGTVIAFATTVVLSVYLFFQITTHFYAPIALSNWAKTVIEQIHTKASQSDSPTLHSEDEALRNSPATESIQHSVEAENPQKFTDADIENLVRLTGRTDLWKSLIKRIRERPYLGYGFQSFWKTEETFQRVFEDIEFWDVRHAHNGFIELWIDLGLVGLIVFMFGFWGNYIRNLLPLRSDYSLTQLWALGYCIYFILGNLTEARLVRFNTIYFVLFVSTVFSLRAMQKTKHSKGQYAVNPS